MTRITSIDQTQIICTGLVNLRRFEQRGAETLVVAEMFDRRVTLADGSGDATIEDIAMDKHRSGDWFVSKLFVRRGHSLSPLGRLRRNETLIIDWADAPARAPAPSPRPPPSSSPRTRTSSLPTSPKPCRR